MSFPLEQLTALNVPVTRLVTDSRAVQPGDTFVAYPGETADGRQFIGQAIERGANAVIWEAQHFAWNDAWQVPNLPVSDLRHRAGWLAHAVYGAPSTQLCLIGITGTNGKTSTSHWIAHALNDAGRKCALIGTLGNGFVDALQPSANTTPDAVRVHGLLAQYLSHGAQAVAMEVSSHALAQGRVNGAQFEVALLTNLSRDHLDYHGDMQSYANCKRKLFDWDQLKYAVLNLDDAFGAELAEQLQHPAAEVIGYGVTEMALQLGEQLGIRTVYGHVVEMSGQGLELRIHSSWGGMRLRSPLIGRFNAANLMGALAVLLACDISLNDAVTSLGKVEAVAGRMQRLGASGQPTVIVDYAHTPDALEKVLLTLREVSLVAPVSACRPNVAAEAEESEPMRSRRVICVFGCGGDRDRGKRAMMGLVAEKIADHCIVTSDNPRSEVPEDIIAAVVSGMSGDKHEVVVERAAAIRRAVAMAQCGDIVLVAGKGHEDYQEIMGERHPFSDVVVAQQALQEWPGQGVGQPTGGQS